MANNRLFIGCPSTGKMQMIARHTGDEWKTINGVREMLDSFFHDSWVEGYQNQIVLMMENSREIDDLVWEWSEWEMFVRDDVLRRTKKDNA